MTLKRTETEKQEVIRFVHVMLVRKSSPRFVSAVSEVKCQGQRCASLRCGVRFHNHCSATFFSPRNNSCPSCKVEWKDHLPVGEMASSDRNRRRISNKPQTQQRRRSVSQESGASSSPTRTPNTVSTRTLVRASRSPGSRREGSRRGSSRRTSGAASIQEEDEEEEDIYG